MKDLIKFDVDQQTKFFIMGRFESDNKRSISFHDVEVLFNVNIRLKHKEYNGWTIYGDTNIFYTYDELIKFDTRQDAERFIDDVLNPLLIARKLIV